MPSGSTILGIAYVVADSQVQVRDEKPRVLEIPKRGKIRRDAGKCRGERRAVTVGGVRAPGQVADDIVECYRCGEQRDVPNVPPCVKDNGSERQGGRCRPHRKTPNREEDDERRGQKREDENVGIEEHARARAGRETIAVVSTLRPGDLPHAKRTILMLAASTRDGSRSVPAPGAPAPCRSSSIGPSTPIVGPRCKRALFYNPPALFHPGGKTARVDGGLRGPGATGIFSNVQKNQCVNDCNACKSSSRVAASRRRRIDDGPGDSHTL